MDLTRIAVGALFLRMHIDMRLLDEDKGISSTLLGHEATWHSYYHAKITNTNLEGAEKNMPRKVPTQSHLIPISMHVKDINNTARPQKSCALSVKMSHQNQCMKKPPSISTRRSRSVPQIFKTSDFLHSSVLET